MSDHIQQPNNPMAAALDAVAQYNAGHGARMGGAGGRVLPPNPVPQGQALSPEEQFAQDWGHPPGNPAPGVARPDAVTDEPVPHPQGVQPTGPLAPMQPPPEMVMTPQQVQRPGYYGSFPQPQPVQQPVQMQAPAPPPVQQPLTGFVGIDLINQVLVGNNGEMFPVPEEGITKLNQFCWDIMVFIRNVQAAQLREAMGLTPPQQAPPQQQETETEEAPDDEQPTEPQNVQKVQRKKGAK